MCCAGGRAVLQAIDEDGIQQNAATVSCCSCWTLSCPVLKALLHGAGLGRPAGHRCRWLLAPLHEGVPALKPLQMHEAWSGFSTSLEQPMKPWLSLPCKRQCQAQPSDVCSPVIMAPMSYKAALVCSGDHLT